MVTDVHSALNHLNEILTVKFNTQATYIYRIKGKCTTWLDESIQPLIDERDKLLRKSCKKTKRNGIYVKNKRIYVPTN